MEDYRMKRAVFFLPPFCGGAERMTIAVAKLLDRSVYDVHFVVVGEQLREIKEFIPDDYSVSLIKIRNIFDFTTLRVYRRLKKLKPQYVFCSLHYLNPRVIQAASCVGNCKIIVRFNCSAYQVTGLLKVLTKITYPKADVVIAQTEQMKKDIISSFNLPADTVITLHNLLDTGAIQTKLIGIESPYPDNGQKNIVWVGRFYKTKGVEIAIRAFEKAAKIDKQIHLYLVGKFNEKDDYYCSIKKLIESTGLKDKIHCIGFQANPYQWMKFANCFVLSSISEGSPNVLFEALYLGVPAVSTRCTPNIDDIIIDGINGYKVDVGDSSEMGLKILDAIKLKNVKSIYNHSASADFIQLFD